MAQILVGGLSTYYEQVGTGPVILCLHGWANTIDSWLPVAPYLLDHFSVVFVDLPGCGKTATPDVGWSTKDHALWLSEFIRSTGCNPFGVIGHSFGGKMLLEYCSGNYSPAPKKIVLIDASGIPNILTTRQKILRTLATYTPEYIKNALTSALRRKLYASFGADSDYVFANSFQKKTLAIILTEDYTKRLASIGIPTLILWGKDDTDTPLWQGESMHTLIPLNQFKTYAAGHYPHHEYPEIIGRDIVAFLSA